MFLALALHLVLAAPSLSTESIPNDFPVQLGVSLQLTHPAEMERLRAAQLDPTSPDFRRWLTPQEFGARFGQSAAAYEEVAAWLRHAGLEVTLYPSRAFLEAHGTAAQVESLLAVQLLPVEGEAFAVHTLGNKLQLPPRFAPIILNISGLDTRVRVRHHLQMAGNQPASFGPQDLRRFYGLQPLLDQGFVGQGQKLVVLSTALPPGKTASPIAINYFLQNISDATAPFIQRVLANPGNDYDNQAGGNLEFELDVQMQSVGAPGADSLTLEIVPASQVFILGPNDIVNNLPTTTAVSVSLGLCEQGEQQNDAQSGQNEIGGFRNALIQGTMEGQTWSAASGDNGANDCRNGMTVAADFPSVIPEFVAAGGSSVPNPAWDVNHALMAYQQEVTWNDGAQGGAAGGGRSIIFPIPAYQTALNLPGTGGRSVPDIALISGLPGVGVASALPPGELGPVEGTSVASPLSAGFFGLIASRVGCRLGDVHAALYQLGIDQTDGGAPVFHDITSGNLTVGTVVGPSAGPGYDSATGWGSLNVAVAAANWPACPTLPDGGSFTFDAGLQVVYTQCGFLACDGGCTTLPEGPSTCSPACNPATAGSCPVGSVCSLSTVYTSGNTGSCVPGCANAADCASQPGTVCSSCSQICVPAGTAGSKVGTACNVDSQCPSGAYCSLSRTFPTATAGYCTYDCAPGVPPTDACACPGGSVCGRIGRGFPVNICLATCNNVGEDCGRTGYLCQPQSNGTKVCMPKCAITMRNGMAFDSCASIGTTKTCDVPSGICGGPVAIDAGVPDAGAVDAGAPADAGDPDAGGTGGGGGSDVQIPAVSGDLGPQTPQGCGCGAIDGPLWGAALALLLARRRSNRVA